VPFLGVKQVDVAHQRVGGCLRHRFQYSAKTIYIILIRFRAVEIGVRLGDDLDDPAPRPVGDGERQVVDRPGG
jgi:hypothetical protein